MTIDEARDLVEKAIEEARAGGYNVWGWDDGSVIIAPKKGPYKQRVIDLKEG